MNDNIEEIFQKYPDVFFTKNMPPVIPVNEAQVGDCLLTTWKRSDKYLSCSAPITEIHDDYFICGRGGHKARIEKDRAIHATRKHNCKLIRKPE